MTLPVPANPLRPRRPDDHFAPEADAARTAGIDVAVVDHDALTRGDPHRAVMAVPTDGVAVHYPVEACVAVNDVVVVGFGAGLLAIRLAGEETVAPLPEVP